MTPRDLMSTRVGAVRRSGVQFLGTTLAERAIVRSLRTHEVTPGQRVDVDLASPLVPGRDEMMFLGRNPRALAPLQRIKLPIHCRVRKFQIGHLCFYGASHHSIMHRVFLNQFRGRPETFRHIQKRFARFISCCVCFRRKAMS